MWSWNIPDRVSLKDEKKLAKKAFKGDSTAREALALSNIRLALSYAMSRGPGQDRDEAVSAALHGLWVAAIKFDPSQGMRFSTYATWWIKATIALHKRQSRRLLSYAPSMIQLDREIARSRALYGSGIECNKSLKKIASRLGMRPGAVMALWNSTVQKLHLDCPISDEMTFADTIQSKDGSPEESLIAKRDAEAAKALAGSLLTVLSDKERYVVHGVTVREETFGSIGRKIGVTRQRVKQIFDGAVCKMRQKALCCNPCHAD